MNFTEILHGTLSPDQNIRVQATNALDSVEKDNFPQYVTALIGELVNEGNNTSVRMAAGIALKNTLTAREDKRKEEYMMRWLQVDPSVRNQIKQGVLGTLATSDSQASRAAAQTIAAIAAIELPQNQWPDAINTLLTNVNTQNEHLKKASLQAIGYICESIDPEILASQSNTILTAVVQGANASETNQEVRHAAITALYNSLEFVRENFEREGERNVIMQTICEATQSPSVAVQVTAFECLVRIMQLYYDKMQFYMEKALYGLTILGMKHEEEKIALQAIEFWSTVCDEEIELALDEAEAEESGQPIEVRSHRFALTALPQILPTLLWLLTKQDEDADEDEWNISMAAATCLSLLAQTVEDAIVPQVIPFVEQNIRNPDWHFREAAVMAFGSILEGPQATVLAPLVSQALPVLIEMLKDESVHVKDTAAWTLGRVCELLIECIQLDVHLHNLLSALVEGLKDNQRIVSNCCWAIMNLTEQLGGADADTYPLSQYFEGIVATLMQITESNVNENNSRVSAYEAMATLCSTGAKDTHPTIGKLAVAIIERLEFTIKNQSQVLNMDDRLALLELQSHLLAVLTNAVRALGAEVSAFSDKLMTDLLEILTTAGHSSVVEDVFLTVGALITSLGPNFKRYFDSFSPFLNQALQNYQEIQLCSISVGMIGDICRGFGPDVKQYCDAFMQILLKNLESAELSRDVKPPILSCFGDIAMAIGGEFHKYLEYVLPALASACTVSANMQPTDFDTIDYNNQLRSGIFEAYVGIIQGLKSSNQCDAISPHVQPLFEFLRIIFMDSNRTEDVTRPMIGLVGDLADAFPQGQIKEQLQADWVNSLIKEGRQSPRGSTMRMLARYAREKVKAATSA
ncbi:karyopherin Kap95 [Spiromyces aspiralis]|uniref:Karyopherin Kap95 n=1 Tax=Spiromyces aspiralis TaxID=68401 RepID=A0ACC1HGS0_9FUNG|nr:karyopherin Kap95 [Spiromyces aspiralis]